MKVEQHDATRAPWLVATPLRAWHRADRIIPVDDVRVDWGQRTVTLTRVDRARHPHNPDRGDP